MGNECSADKSTKDAGKTPCRELLLPIVVSITLALALAVSGNRVGYVGYGILLLLTGGAIVWCCHRGDATTRRQLLALFVAGMLLRICWAATMQVDSPFRDPRAEHMFVDEDAYYNQGLQLAEGWKRGESVSPAVLAGGAHFGYLVYVAAHLVWLPPDPFYPILTNCLLGALTILPVFLLGQLAAGRTAGLLAATLIAFHPSAAFWSGVLLKDVTIALLFTWGVWEIAKRQSKTAWTKIIWLPLIVCALATVRIYAALALTIVLIIDAITSLYRRPRQYRVQLVAAVLIVVLFVMGMMYTPAGFVFRMVRNYGLLPSLAFARQGMIGQTGMEERTFAFAGTNFVYALPLMMVHQLLTPLPWKATGAYKLYVAGHLLWWVLLPFMLIGVLRILSHRHPAFVILSSFLVLFAVAAIIYSGAGARHQMQILPLGMVLGAVGIMGVMRALHWAPRMQTSPQVDRADI